MQSFLLDQREATINTLTTLDQIQALSNERQQLWRMAHKDKFSHGWWKRHDRIESIGKQLVRLWHLRRVELAGYEEWQSIGTDRLASDHFADYRARAGADTGSIWRIEDETSSQRRYMSVEEGFRAKQYEHYVEKPSGSRSNKPNVGARRRKRAIQGMIQLN